MKECERVERILEDLALYGEEDAKFLGKYIKKLHNMIEKLRVGAQDNV